MDLSLSLIMTRSVCKAYNNKEIIKYFQERPEAFDTLVRLIFEDNATIPNDLLEVLLMLSKRVILEFWNNGDSCQLVYLLLLILKRNSFDREIEPSWLNINS